MTFAIPNLSLGFGDSSAYQNKTGDNQTFFGNINAGGTVADAFLSSGPSTVAAAAVNSAKTMPVILGVIGAGVLLYLFLKKKGKV
jgi:hypothetical protein